jgi:hypothetical protein
VTLTVPFIVAWIAQRYAYSREASKGEPERGTRPHGSELKRHFILLTNISLSMLLSEAQIGVPLKLVEGALGARRSQGTRRPDTTRATTPFLPSPAPHLPPVSLLVVETRVLKGFTCSHWDPYLWEVLHG